MPRNSARSSVVGVVVGMFQGGFQGCLSSLGAFQVLSRCFFGRFSGAFLGCSSQGSSRRRSGVGIVGLRRDAECV